MHPDARTSVREGRGRDTPKRGKRGEVRRGARGPRRCPPAGHRSLAARLWRSLRDRARVLPLLQDLDEHRQGAEVSETRSKAAPFAIASAAVCILGIGISLMLPEPGREPALYGAASAALGAVCAFSALTRGVAKGSTGVLTGFSIGFLCRAGLVAAGLLASGPRGNLALIYAGAFFVLYAATQVIEVLFVHASSRPQGATP